MGVVHHSRYFPWFEVGRTEFFKTSGMSYREVEENDVLLPLLDCYCKFIKGLSIRMMFGLRLFKEIGQLAKCVFEYNVIRVTVNY